MSLFVHKGSVYRHVVAISKEEMKTRFDAVAKQQRGRAEEAMVEARKALGGIGVFPYALEHIGDLLHRMTEYAFEHTSYGFDAVFSKLRVSLRDLKHYDFEQKFQDSITWMAEDQGIDRDDLQARAEAALNEYATAHMKLPTYNKAQRLAQCAAVMLGQRDFDGAINCLEGLQRYLGSEEEWVAFIQQYDGPNRTAEKTT